MYIYTTFVSNQKTYKMSGIIKAVTTNKQKTNFNKAIANYCVKNGRIYESGIVTLMADAFIKNPKETINQLNIILNKK